jgi:hypothetical protein
MLKPAAGHQMLLNTLEKLFTQRPWLVRVFNACHL